MKQFIPVVISITLLVSLTPLHSMDEGSSTAAITRIPVAGAQYTAMGNTGDATSDDVYSIYWNPAGLAEIVTKKKMTPREIKEKARAGKIDEISEESLLKFSEDEQEKRIVELGLSGLFIDDNRYGLFGGIAFNAGPGVLGLAGSSVFSVTLPSYYVAGVAHFAYGWTMDIVTMGVSLKVIYEDDNGTKRMGFGVDIGLRVQILPTLEVSLVGQNLGIGLFSLENISTGYSFGSPTVRLGAALKTDTGFGIAVSIIKRTDVEALSAGFGLSYSPHEVITFYLGLTDLDITAGLTLKFRNFTISYGFSMDDGYNHTVSMTLLL